MSSSHWDLHYNVHSRVADREGRFFFRSNRSFSRQLVSRALLFQPLIFIPPPCIPRISFAFLSNPGAIRIHWKPCVRRSVLPQTCVFKWNLVPQQHAEWRASQTWGRICNNNNDVIVLGDTKARKADRLLQLLGHHDRHRRLGAWCWYILQVDEFRHKQLGLQRPLPFREQTSCLSLFHESGSHVLRELFYHHWATVVVQT